MRVLLVGAGPMAVGYAAVLKAQGLAFTVVGRGAMSAERFENTTGIRPRLGGIDGIEPPESPADSAIVAVSISELAQTTRRLVSAGWKRLLIEKPAGLDAAEIARLAGDVAGSKCDAYVAYNRRFYASVASARRMLAEDGGVTSVHFDFSELVPRILTPDKSREVLANWFYANATHVIDLAFHLAGEPTTLSADVAGRLDWHEPAKFAGHGRTRNGAMFSYHADWTAPGRWGVEVRSRSQRIILQPLEQLKSQPLTGFAAQDIVIDDSRDRAFKPGLYDQVAAFLSDSDEDTPLLSLADQARRLPALEAMRTGGNLPGVRK